MKIRGFTLCVLTLFALLAGLACVSCTKNQSTQRISTMKTDAAELSKFVALPFPPKAVWWRTTEREGSGAMGPSDWELMAVVQFSPQYIESIISRSKSLKSDSPEKIVAGSHGMIEMLKGHGSVGERLYSAELFAKSPLLEGFVVQIKGTDKLFVYFSTH